RQRDADDPAIHCVITDGRKFISGLLIKYDTQTPAVGETDPLAKPAKAAETIQRSRNGARVLTQLGRFALKTIDFFDYFDGNQNIVFLKTEYGIGIVEE